MPVIGCTDNAISQVLYQVKRVVLSPADVIAMRVTPVTVIPSPGANKGIVLTQWCLNMVFNSVQYTGGGTISLVYAGTARAVGTGVAAATITSAASTLARGNFGLSSNNPISEVTNKAVTITNGTAAFAAGNSNVRLTFWYFIVDTV